MGIGDRGMRLGGPLQAAQSKLIPDSLGTHARNPCFSDTREGGADPSVEDSGSTHHQLLGALTAYLTALMGLYLLYKICEWMVRGPSWLAHRCLAIDLGCAVAKSIDLVADRIVCLGGIPLPDLSNQTVRSYWRGGSIVPTQPQEMLAASLWAERQIVKELDGHRELARACQDYLTEDVLSHLQAKHGCHIVSLLAVKFGGLDPHDCPPE
jgi:DNA-binding ferritin-like protein